MIYGNLALKLEKDYSQHWSATAGVLTDPRFQRYEKMQSIDADIQQASKDLFDMSTNLTCQDRETEEALAELLKVLQEGMPNGC